MKKLELKHLAPYLPYGLKIMRPDNRTILEMVGLVSDWMIFHEEHGETFGAIHGYSKPILRPLSDLTKEIEHNGEKFMPIEKLKETGVNCFAGCSDDLYLKTLRPYDIPDLQYYEFQQMIIWHFDCFGLIDEGLAIDINTLEK